MVTNSRQVLDAAPANQNNGVLLKVMPYARNVSRHLGSRRQFNASNFPQSRVRFFRSRGGYARTNPSPLRARAKSRGLRTRRLTMSSVSDELIDCGHIYFSFPLAEACLAAACSNIFFLTLKPVPAGIMCPMMTFSLSPFK